MELQDIISPVGELWRGSSLALQEAGNLTPVTLFGHNNAVIILMLAVAALTIVFFRQIALSVAGSFVALFSENRRDDIFNDASYGQLSTMTTLILVPMYAFVLFYCSLGGRSYWMILASVAALLLYRRAMFALIGWINGTEAVNEVKNFSDSTFIMMMSLSQPVFIVAYLFGNMSRMIPAIYLAVVATLCLIPYLAIACKKILAIKFSRFFCFLYLCVLEILPIAVVVKIIVS
ncbi:MAG: DUF4271 domain-containing protein [Bacteroidales bacterium]|nr:DUF4271 domain-containing protein [Bacteroidales bacterium]